MKTYFGFCFWQVATEKDFLEAVNKVIKAYAKFSATPRYMTYNWEQNRFFVECLFLYRSVFGEKSPAILQTNQM